MALRRDDEWGEDFQLYSPDQIGSIIGDLGIEVTSETPNHFICLCPFHGNTNTAAFEVENTKGLFVCFNPSCAASGSLVDLVKRVKGCKDLEAMVYIAKHKKPYGKSAEERIAELRAAKLQNLPELEQEKIDEWHHDFWDSPAYDYMRGRGFVDDTLKEFEVGYRPKYYNKRKDIWVPEMVVVPMHDFKGNPIGYIGRALDSKEFKNSWKLPKSLTAFNVHRAKKFGGTAVVVEASFDTMSAHQAGYPNTVGLLGGHFSNEIATQLGRYFDKIIIATDFETKKEYRPNCKICMRECDGHRPGRDLGRAIVKGLPMKKVLWAAYDDTCVYPHGAKDYTDLTDDEIRKTLKNAIPNYEYEAWEIER